MCGEIACVWRERCVYVCVEGATEVVEGETVSCVSVCVYGEMGMWGERDRLRV